MAVYTNESVNDALRTMRRFQLDVTNAMAQNLEKIQQATLGLVQECLDAAEELRIALGPGAAS
ncbi:MAG: hypothetical protein WAN87_08750 [Thermoplasmata archaeon]